MLLHLSECTDINNILNILFYKVKYQSKQAPKIDISTILLLQ